MKKLFRSQMVCSILLMLTIFLVSCKQDITVSPIVAAVEPQVGSTKIVDLDIQGVSLQDGMLNFVNNEALSKAKALINGANSASYKAFCEKIGFKSLALIDDEFTVQLDKCSTQEEALALVEANKDIMDASNDHIRLKNTNSDLLRLLNRNSIIKVKNALYRFDEKGEILVSNGDMNAMNRAIADRRQTENVAIFNAPLPVRTPCFNENTSGWQYSQGSDRRAYVSTNLIHRYYENDRDFTKYDVVINFYCNAVAEKKTIFKTWRSYTTDNKLTITEVKVRYSSSSIHLPNPSRYKFYLNEVRERSGSSVGFDDEVHKETIFRSQFSILFWPGFEYVDVSYENRGGVTFDYRCDN